MGPREEVKLPMVESEGVVWEVRESIYTPSSPLLSSLSKLSGNSLKSEEYFDFKSAEPSWLEASMCWVGFAWGETCLFPVFTWGALGTPGNPLSSSSYSSGPWGYSTSCPPCCLTLPCRGSNRFWCRILVLPPATFCTLYTGIPGLGCPITWYASLSHLSCILCLHFQAVFLTRTRSPMSSAAPLHLLSYNPLCLACCLPATCLSFLWANLSLLLSWVI